MKLEARLESMISKSYMYNATEHRIMAFKIFPDQVMIVTDKAWKNIPLTKINAELENFLPIEPEKGKNDAIVLSSINENQKSLSKTVMENIEKIKADASYIPQAKAVNDQIKTMIAMAKVEIDLMKLKEKTN